MRIIIQYITILLLFWSCNSQKLTKNSAVEEKTKLVISYSQQSGLTQETPEYTLELYSNRQMYLTAIKNLDKQGKFMRILSENEYNQAIEAFNSAKFFKFDDEYTSPATDLPTRYLYFSYNGNEKKVKDYQNAPEKLTELEYLMQSFLDRVGWEKKCRGSFMQFPKPLIHGTLIKRYKRFLADIKLDSGEIVIAHTTNSGSMKSCIEEGAEVFLSAANDPKRKTQFTWEMIKINGNWVGINTAWPNLLAFEAIKNNVIEKLAGYTFVKREAQFGDSRFDVYCENDHEKCFVEVKNVTYKLGDYALFPDAISTRGQKHLKTLIEVKKQGIRAVMLYIIQRSDVSIFGPATQIDPAYALALKAAIESGVEIIAIQASVSPNSIHLTNELKISI